MYRWLPGLWCFVVMSVDTTVFEDYTAYICRVEVNWLAGRLQCSRLYQVLGVKSFLGSCLYSDTQHGSGMHLPLVPCI
jgi:hypothetical protein